MNNVINIHTGQGQPPPSNPPKVIRLLWDAQQKLDDISISDAPEWMKRAGIDDINMQLSSVAYMVQAGRL